MNKVLPVLIVMLFISISKVFSQDTLPHFSVKNSNNKIIVSWKNTYGATITNINIQRSADSLRNFTSIGSVLEPMNRENGYVDNKAPNATMFYRIFVSFAGGRYLFTSSMRPVIDTSNNSSATTDTPGEDMFEEIVKPTNKPLISNVFVPSKFIYTARDNNVIVNLPNAAINKYNIIFYDEKDNIVFEISRAVDPYLIIEKVNFKHSGWFHFQLSENGLVKEKHKFFIGREGRK